MDEEKQKLDSEVSKEEETTIEDKAIDSKEEELGDSLGGLDPVEFNTKTVVTIMVAALLFVVLFYFLFGSAFRLKHYVVNGNRVVSDDEIINLVGVENNTHLFRRLSGDFFQIITFHYGDLEDRIEAQYPYISDIDIHVTIPSTITINVVEREKVAYIRTPDGYAAIDADGVVLELGSGEPSDIHPLICGLDINSVVIGEPIGITDNTNYQKMIIVLGAVLGADVNSGVTEFSFFESLLEIRMLISGSYFLTFALPEGSVLQVKLDAIDTINDKMAWLLTAIAGGSFDSLPDGVLDMTGDEPIYRSYN